MFHSSGSAGVPECRVLRLTKPCSPGHNTPVAIGLTAAEMNAVLGAVAEVAIPVVLRFLWRPRLKDPADEMVLATAVSGNADRMVTFNTRHLSDVAADFGIRALRPVEAWKQVQKHEKK
jgi:predicted nucleic acid-binding protein